MKKYTPFGVYTVLRLKNKPDIDRTRRQNALSFVVVTDATAGGVGNPINPCPARLRLFDHPPAFKASVADGLRPEPLWLRFAIQHLRIR